MASATGIDAAAAPPYHRIPATVLVGFLGAGKTTLLNHLLAEEHGRKLAVVVNDFSHVNVDARLVRHTSERLVEMSNGCICCTLRDDLIQELSELARLPGLDGIVIESTGIGEPMPIAQAFYMGDLPERVRLEEIVTVVDGANFWTDFERSDMIEDAEGNPADAPLAPLLVDQLEYTNVVLLNKADLATPETLDRVECFVRGLNPQAKIYRTVNGRIDPALVLGTKLFDYDLGPEAAGWDEAWEQDAASEADEYGFNTFSYVAADPFRHASFMALFEDWHEEILRAKGFVRFVDHPPIMISVVRNTMELQTLVLDDDLSIEFGDGAADEWADAETEIAFIGRGMPVEVIVARLDACIVDSQKD